MDWRYYFENRHRILHGSEYQLVLGEAAEDTQIAELFRELHCDLPEEFREIYGQLNGVGLKMGSSVDWELLPTFEIPKFATRVRHWFSKTHPKVASMYVPVYDFGNGDAIGYYVDRNELIQSNLFLFQHEKYKFEESQPWGDFVVGTCVSWLDFFNKSIDVAKSKKIRLTDPMTGMFLD